MAAPADVNIKSLSGKWVINKSLSESTDPVLSLQGIGWLTRKAVGMATITQHLKQYEEDGVTHIDFDQTLTGGIQGTSEKRTLDYQYRAHTDHIFGDVSGKSRWVKLDKLVKENEGKDIAEDVQYLVEGWDDETKTGEAVESYVTNEDKGWTAWQIWGFATINGERRHVRKVVCRKGKEAKKVRLVYDWAGKE